MKLRNFPPHRWDVTVYSVYAVYRLLNKYQLLDQYKGHCNVSGDLFEGIHLCITLYFSILRDTKCMTSFQFETCLWSGNHLNGPNSECCYASSFAFQSQN